MVCMNEGDAGAWYERGSTTVLVAAIMLLAGILALVTVDLLRVLQAKSRVQTAADAAALAAAQELAIPSGHPPQGFAADYAERNGATLISCRCDPGTAEAVVEVQMPVTLVFFARDRTVTALARAVVDGAFPGPAGRMAANDPDGWEWNEGQAPRGAWRRRLHAGQEGAVARLPLRAALAPRDLRRAPRAASGRAIPGVGSVGAVPGLPGARAPPPGLRLRRRAEARQRAGLRAPGGSGAGRQAARGSLLRGRGLHRLQLESPERGLHGPHGRLNRLNPLGRNRTFICTNLQHPLGE
jgi:secretion/DNA translocation related TadE-like protein